MGERESAREKKQEGNRKGLSTLWVGAKRTASSHNDVPRPLALIQVPIIAVVGNDACWTQIAREQVPMFNSGVACDLVRNDYHVVAQGEQPAGLCGDKA